VQELRKQVPRSTFGAWRPPRDRDPFALLAEQELHRQPELLPLRHERMAASPFAFYRGSAIVMAADLATVPVTGINVQACGDAHIANFGGYASPERNVVFDLNDFDETIPGPWEWDVLRMVTSVALAARHRAFSRRAENNAVLGGIEGYRTGMNYFAGLSPLATWYEHLNIRDVARRTPVRQREALMQKLREAKRRTAENLLPKLTDGSNPVFVDKPPIVHRLGLDGPLGTLVHDVLARYRESLPAHVRVLHDRFRLQDIAHKVVGVGSVGTMCMISLSLTERGQPLLLQVKEAQSSVLEPYVKPSVYSNHGERVVQGQRLMQTVSDIFLGWTTMDGRDFYVRQLRDMKVSADLEWITARQLLMYAQYCGWTLARAHARSGDAEAIAAYLGTSDTFDVSAASFAQTYADLAEADHAQHAKSTAT
jgi:uncharacterized protein (DUF2252 family)